MNLLSTRERGSLCAVHKTWIVRPLAIHFLKAAPIVLKTYLLGIHLVSCYEELALTVVEIEKYISSVLHIHSYITYYSFISVIFCHQVSGL